MRTKGKPVSNSCRCLLPLISKAAAVCWSGPSCHIDCSENTVVRPASVLSRQSDISDCAGIRTSAVPLGLLLHCVCFSQPLEATFSRSVVCKVWRTLLSGWSEDFLYFWVLLILKELVCACLYWSEQEEIGSAEEKAWMGDRKIGYTQKMRISGVVAKTEVLVPIYLASYLALLCANWYRTNLFISLSLISSGIKCTLMELAISLEWVWGLER